MLSIAADVTETGRLFHTRVVATADYCDYLLNSAAHKYAYLFGLVVKRLGHRTGHQQVASPTPGRALPG